MRSAILGKMAKIWRRLAKWLSAFGQFFWPWLEKHTPKQRQDIGDSLKSDVVLIEAFDFAKDSDAALDEARRLADSETERRRGTDQKAATYLPLVAALIPLVLTLVSALWEKKAGGAPIWLNLLLLGLAVAYTASAGYWAFKELKVSVTHEPGISDFERAWGAPHPKQTLTRQLLLHTRRNRKGINWKVTCIKMAHEFLLRAFLTFSLLLLVNIGWYLAGFFIRDLWPESGPDLTTPKQTITAVVEVDRLATQLKREAAWIVLDRECRQRSTSFAALTFSPGPIVAATKIPAVLRPVKGESGAVLKIKLYCAGSAVGWMRVWFIPARLVATKQLTGLPDPLAVSAIDDVTAVTQNWPPTDVKVDPAKLPTTLLRQTVLRRDSTGRPIALAITAIRSSALKTP
jgi:hypothetical protein